MSYNSIGGKAYRQVSSPQRARDSPLSFSHSAEEEQAPPDREKMKSCSELCSAEGVQSSLQFLGRPGLHRPLGQLLAVWDLEEQRVCNFGAYRAYCPFLFPLAFIIS